MLLREKDRLRILAIFSTMSTPVEVWAYGSRVNGTAHSGSDLDLVIQRMDGTPIPYREMARLREQIEESNIPILVEVRDMCTLPLLFKNEIEKSRERL